ncbi:hypothetical protein [Bacillus thuringiensis]|uniref:Uncharacterized protein n=1 Tax=Bacillus thuringiensis TaxID=1428 RepID=A0A9X6WLH5_BACTU|nr:hypothetical protein [Bacillus thuringiensis]PFJ36443.1 hypothetical protein COJ15_22790 [Bacillus thuringiensis]
MSTRIIDLLIGMACGFYLPPTIPVMGLNVHWVLVALCFMVAYRGLKKLGKFLWTKLVTAIANELKKQNDLKA